MRVKICGITKLDQACAIAQLGANALGFIGVEHSKRYLPPEEIAAITAHLPNHISCIGVFANSELETITAVLQEGNFTGIQLHGQETPQFCHQLRCQCPNLEIIKTIAVKDQQSLSQTQAYQDIVDTFLFDTYHPQQLGGTGQAFNWNHLEQFRSPRPWFLAGGLHPNNLEQALTITQPHGIDLSSGVERAPGDKDLALVSQLFDLLGKL